MQRERPTRATPPIALAWGSVASSRLSRPKELSSVFPWSTVLSRCYTEQARNLSKGRAEDQDPIAFLRIRLFPFVLSTLATKKQNGLPADLSTSPVVKRHHSCRTRQQVGKALSAQVNIPAQQQVPAGESSRKASYARYLSLVEVGSLVKSPLLRGRSNGLWRCGG